MKIWLDDVRKAPEGWLWFQDWPECQRFMELQTDISEISLDHDLGEHDVRNFVYWLLAEDKVPPVVRVHSSNPIGANWLMAILRSAGHKPIHTTLTELREILLANSNSGSSSGSLDSE